MNEAGAAAQGTQGSPEELSGGMDEAGAATLQYATPHELLGLEETDRQELERRIKQALERFRGTGLLHAANLQLPIMRGAPPTNMWFVLGYEGGAYDPAKLGVACIVVPPTDGRGKNTLGDYNLHAVRPPALPFPPPPPPSSISIPGESLRVSPLPPRQDGKKSQTSQPGLVKKRMTVRPHKGKEPGPDLPGRYCTF